MLAEAVLIQNVDVPGYKLPASLPKTSCVLLWLLYCVLTHIFSLTYYCCLFCLNVNVHNPCTFQTHTWVFLKSQVLLFSRRIGMQIACCTLTSLQHSVSPEDQGNKCGKAHILLLKTCFAKSSASSPWREVATSATILLFCLVPWYMCIWLYHSIRGVGKLSVVMRS